MHRASAAPQPPPNRSAVAANTILATAPPSSAAAWDTETGLRLQALEAQWYNSANGAYFLYSRRTVDAVLADPNWNAPGRSPYADALLGRQLMLLYRVTLKPDYYASARQLRNRLAPSCGLAPESIATPPSPPTPQPCVAQAFLSNYAAEFQRPQDLLPLARSFAQSSTSAATHPAQDPSFAQAWSAASLVESLPNFPQGDPAHAHALTSLRQLAAQLPGSPSPSATADCLTTYALLKAVRLHQLPPSFRAVAMRAWNRRLASVRQPDPTNPATSLGAFLLASTEADLAPTTADTVLLDAWFNSQQRTNAAGQPESFHYKFTDFSDSGYSLFDHMLQSAGLQTQTLFAAPTAANLQSAAYYLIVSPDIPIKNPNPHYITPADADVIAAWVHRGGVLILMENDPPNADIEHLNLLADRFGIHFLNVLHHHVLNDRVHGDLVESGSIPVSPGGPLFHQSHTLYMKDTCAISLSRGATALLTDRGDVVMATARYGRGTVYANVDPWLYNEYTDGRNNPAVYSQFDNFAAGRELVQWLIQQRPQSPSPAKQKGKQ